MNAVTFNAATQKNPSLLPAIAFRRSLKLYCLTLGLILLLLLLTAWSIDLASNFDNVRAKAAERGTALWTVLVPYLGYRAVDIVARLLSVACFVALFVAENLRRRRTEAIVLSAAGYSPAQGIAAVLALSLMVGSLQVALETWWRPAAVFAQVELGVGAYARRFKRGPTDDVRWFVAGGDAMRGIVVRTDEPELREVEFYRGYQEAPLEEVVVASRATPTGTDGLWRLHDAVVWQRGADGPAYERTRSPEIDVEFALIPEQLTYAGIAGFYLPQKVLNRIAAMRDAPDVADMDMALWRRWTAFFLPGAFALLGASLGQAVWTGHQQAPLKLLAFCALGYISVVSVKIFFSLGELGSIPPSIAVTASILFALAVSGLVQAARS